MGILGKFKKNSKEELKEKLKKSLRMILQVQPL
jgi:hypothetical protein